MLGAMLCKWGFLGSWTERGSLLSCHVTAAEHAASFTDWQTLLETITFVLNCNNWATGNDIKKMHAFLNCTLHCMTSEVWLHFISKNYKLKFVKYFVWFVLIPHFLPFNSVFVASCYFFLRTVFPLYSTFPFCYILEKDTVFCLVFCGFSLKLPCKHQSSHIIMWKESTEQIQTTDHWHCLAERKPSRLQDGKFFMCMFSRF